MERNEYKREKNNKGGIVTTSMGNNSENVSFERTSRWYSK